MAEFFNQTRQSKSIPLSLLKRGRPFDVPLYWLLRTSDLGREGIEHSGSYRFADHIYRNQPSGRGAFGRWLDAKFLSMPATRTFRNRFLAARDELCRLLHERSGRALDVLSVPCGIPRELVEGARKYGGSLAHVTFHGLDLDAGVLAQAKGFALANGLSNFIAHHGNALDRAAYPEGADFITCTGLIDFMGDDAVERLFRIFHEVLRPGGILLTSGMRRVWISEYLLQIAELRAHYRTGAHLDAIARRVPFTGVATRVDELGILTVLTARK